MAKYTWTIRKTWSPTAVSETPDWALYRELTKASKHGTYRKWIATFEGPTAHADAEAALAKAQEQG